MPCGMKTNNKKKTIFLTGATGLVGSYLLKLLLQHGHKVYCLARNKDNKSAKHRVVDILNFWDKKVYRKYCRNLEALEGDIVEKHLGLSKKNRDLLINTVGEIFHCAAATEFNLSLNKIRKINVDGTKNVLDFALECLKLKKANHISTAFVCGTYAGIFKETDLDKGQKFNTTYERSKFEAEKIVEKYRKKGLWIDIFRPALVLGESKTGKTPVFQGFYQTLLLWKHEIFDIFPGKDVNIYDVPVDMLCKSILKIDAVSGTLNKNYHIFVSKQISIEKILNIASKVLKFKRPDLVPLGNFRIQSLTPTNQIILRNNILNYNPNVFFDSKTTNQILAKNRFTFPKIKIVNFLKFIK